MPGTDEQLRLCLKAEMSLIEKCRSNLLRRRVAFISERPSHSLEECCYECCRLIERTNALLFTSQRPPCQPHFTSRPLLWYSHSHVQCYMCSTVDVLVPIENTSYVLTPLCALLLNRFKPVFVPHIGHNRRRFWCSSLSLSLRHRTMLLKLKPMLLS